MLSVDLSGRMRRRAEGRFGGGCLWAVRRTERRRGQQTALVTEQSVRAGYGCERGREGTARASRVREKRYERSAVTEGVVTTSW